MSAYSSKKRDKEKQMDKASKPMWLEDFLNKTFFNQCRAHHLQRNELNKYCVNCNRTVCHYCALSCTRCQHKTLQIYKHSHKEVVSLAAMEKHIDCSQVQPHQCNTQVVIYLKPLPYCDSAKKNETSSCDICCRRLAAPDLYRYSSIACKVKAVSRKIDDSVPPFISIQSVHLEKKEESTEPSKRRRKRKGTPHRAPLF